MFQRGLTLEPEYRRIFSRRSTSDLSRKSAPDKEYDDEEDRDDNGDDASSSGGVSGVAAAADFSPKTVPAMMRSASGCWTKDLTDRLHRKLLEDSVAAAGGINRSRSSHHIGGNG